MRVTTSTMKMMTGTMEGRSWRLIRSPTRVRVGISSRRMVAMMGRIDDLSS